MECDRMKSPEFATVGSTLVILGIVFGEDPLIGYSLIGAGVLLSIISALKLRKLRKLRTRSQGTGGV
jgi:hypothetical protein